MAAAAPARRSRSGGSDGEARLARAAGAGDLRAFARLYERHEEAAFNLAFRITGSPSHAAEITRQAFLDTLEALTQLGDRAPSFRTSLMFAGRRAAHEAAAQAPSRESAREGPDPDPQRNLDAEALQEDVGAANFRLALEAREALALIEMEAMSYGEIATVMDLDREALPSLIASARLSLHDELRGTDLGSGSGSEDCDQALGLAAMRDDGELEDEEDFEWLLEHLAHCGECRLRLDAMGRAAARYRGWEPVAVPPVLFGETMAAAAQLTGADAQDIPQRSRERAAGLAARGYVAARGLRPTVGGAATAATDALGTLRARASALAVQRRRHRPQRNLMATAGFLVVALGGLSAMVVGAAMLLLQGGDEPDRPAAPAAQAAQPSPPRAAPVQERKRPRRKSRPAAEPTPVAPTPQRVVVIRPQPAPPVRRPAPRPRARPKKQKEAPRQRSPRADITPAPAPRPTPAPAPPAQRVPAPSPPPAVTPPQQGPPKCEGGDAAPC